MVTFDEAVEDEGEAVTAESNDEDLAKSPQGDRECFVILPIGANNADVRKRSDHIFKYVISEVVVPLGYSAVRADNIDQSGAITTQVIEHLLTSAVVIADLSDHNPNVFYELGVLHAFRRPFVQIIAHGQALPFDVQNLRTIFVDVTDLDSVHAAKQRLYGMVKAIEDGDEEVDTPIHYAANLQSLRSSERSESRAIAEVVAEMSGLRRVMNKSLSHNSVRSAEFDAMRQLLEHLAHQNVLTPDDIMLLTNQKTGQSHDSWARGLQVRDGSSGNGGWNNASDDPWASVPAAGSSSSGYDDEPPF